MTFTPKRFAVTLANLAANIVDAVRPIDTKIARAKMEVATGALHELGYGRTPNEVHLVVLDWVRANARPIGRSAFPIARKECTIRVEDEVTEILEKIR